MAMKGATALSSTARPAVHWVSRAVSSGAQTAAWPLIQACAPSPPNVATTHVRVARFVMAPISPTTVVSTSISMAALSPANATAAVSTSMPASAKMSAVTTPLSHPRSVTAHDSTTRHAAHSGTRPASSDATAIAWHSTRQRARPTPYAATTPSKALSYATEWTSPTSPAAILASPVAVSIAPPTV